MHVFMDYGDLLYDYKFSSETLLNAHHLACQYLKHTTLKDISQAHEEAIQAYLKDRNQTLREWQMERIMALMLNNLNIPEDHTTPLTNIYKLNDHQASPKENIPETIRQAAKHHNLHIISNLPHDSALYWLRRDNLLENFSTTTFSFEAGYRKPHQAIYKLAKVKANTQKGLFISHDEEELEGAKKTELETHLATDAYQIREALGL